MDENSYRRVMSRNLDEFGLNQGNRTTSNSTNQSSNFTSSSSNIYGNEYSPGYGTTTNRGGYGTSSSYNTSGNTYNTSSNQTYYNRSMSNDYSSDYGRKKSNINLKQIKAVGLSCAKNLTNKLINLSNAVTGTSSSSTNRTYGTQNIYSSSAANNKYSCSSREVYVINSSGNNQNHPSNTIGNYGANTAGVSRNASSYGTASRPQSHPSQGPSSSTNVVDNRAYTLRCIADRISTTDDLIKNHRELVAVIERCLTHSDVLVEITIEKDRFGAPTLESINRFSLINKVLAEKILTYIKGRRDCCIFVVKFATWRMRTTKKPEEVILSLELIQKCMNDMGGYFLGLFTRSLMKTLRKLLFTTNLKHSITSGVKKKITKFLGKSSYVHPGVSTDIRIHIFKTKIMYMVQLYYEVFLFEQGEYVVFYDGYKDMRIKGIKFPTINPEDKEQINKSYTFSSFNGSNNENVPSPVGFRVMTINLRGPVEIDVRELDQLLQNINNNNYDEQYIQEVRHKLLGTIEVLSSKSNLSEHYSQLLDKILRLNDSLLMLCNTDAAAGNQPPAQGVYAFESVRSNLSSEVSESRHSSYVDSDPNSNRMGAGILGGNSAGVMGRMGGRTNDNAGMVNRQFDNLMEFGDSSVSPPKDEFDFFNPFDTQDSFIGAGAGSNLAGGLGGPGAHANMGGHFGSGSAGVAGLSASSTASKKDDVKENLDDIFNFISLNSGENKEDSDLKDDSDDDDEQLFEDEDELINNFINSPSSFSYMDEGMGPGVPSQGLGEVGNYGGIAVSSVGSFGSNDGNSASVATNVGVVGSSLSNISGMSVSNDPLESARSFSCEPVAVSSIKEEPKLEDLKEVNGENSENKERGPKESKEKNLSELVSELDNLEVDFGHMSVNNF
ncbi:hypothetical protein MACK_001159 [Theileria orientalis]|uniref:VHS domain-containing protein n=1 Tax=Theileria orientalis TaxID=68886 RepID=A0A976QV45_THEOR|nr:hypothetical protein MACK_001159 [Theileria orientalis]